jgi:hypothetical protein
MKNYMSITNYDTFFFDEKSEVSTGIATEKPCNKEWSRMEISGTGNIQIVNTGGSSASEGGMGTGGGTEKGPGINDPAGKKDNQSNSTDSADEDTWDPLKPKEEKQKSKD